MRAQTVSMAKRQRVAAFFKYRCAYCHTAQKIIGPFLEIDHIMPQARGGDSAETNLALACPMCNSYKSDRVDAVDPETQELAPLFHPRRDEWSEHFEWQEGGATISGKTPNGRATVEALRMNHPDIVLVRQMWVQVGWHPPAD
jgi:hypothetical protein